MKKTLQVLCLLAAIFCSTGQTLNAQFTGTAGLAADLSYSWINNDSLTVTYKYYYDCRNSVASPATVTLNYQADGCNAGGNLSLTRVSEIQGQPICGAANNSCSTGTLLNFKEAFYTGTFSLPAQCSNWVLSVTNGIRKGDNLAISGASYLYTDVKLDNSGGIKNMVPVLNLERVYFSCERNATSHNSFFMDPEGDSLVYSLEAPLTGPSLPVVYNPGFSPSAPLGANSNIYVTIFGSISLSLNTTLPANSTLAYRVKITEYRKINGQNRIISEVNRDLIIVIRDCPNTLCEPVLTSTRQPVNTTFEIPADSLTCLDFKLVHNCDTNYFSLRYDTFQPSIGAIIYYNGNDISFCWQPTAAQVRGTPYRFEINTSLIPKCTNPVFRFQPLMVRVYAPVVSGLPAVSVKPTKLAAYPNPYNSEIGFRINLENAVSQKELIIFNQLGQEVGRISLESLQAGENTVPWPNGSKISSGVYIARFLESNGAVTTARFIKLP